MRARKGPPGTRRYGLDLARCWTKAKQRIKDAGGVSPDAASSIVEPVARARKLAELAAPADMRASLALTLGASAEELEADKAGARLILEGAHKRLGIVGLRSGDTIEEGMSERMSGFLAAWFGAAAVTSPRVIDAERAPAALRAAPDETPARDHFPTKP